MGRESFLLPEEHSGQGRRPVEPMPEREVRRIWLHRIVDHDGRTGEEGGIAAWLRLGEACGLASDALWAETGLLPGVRFAVDAYVNFTRTRPWPIGVASSLTECSRLT